MNDLISPLSKDTLWSGEYWEKEGKDKDIKHENVNSLIRFIIFCFVIRNN